MTSPLPKTYDADQVTILVNNIPIQGYADGSFIRIEPESDDFEDVVGTDGEVSRSKTNDRRATITILLMQTSSSNAVLSALSNLDKNAPNGAGIGPFLCRDRQGTSLYQAAACWVRRPPNVDFGRSPGPREWTLRVARLDRSDGGN